MISIGEKRVSVREFLGIKRHPVPRGYTNISEHLPEDIFIVGYPKSGNTWFQNLVAGVVHGVNPVFSPAVLANDLVPDVHFNPVYRRYGTPMFFKSHHLPRPDYRRVVYLVRDGRDAMVSFLHHLEATRGETVDFLEMVSSDKILFPCKWHEHVEAWTANPHDAEILVIKYEDLIQEPVTALQRFCRFVGCERDLAHIEAMTHAASFANLHEKEARLGPVWPESWPKSRFFFRRGTTGSYKDEMPAGVLQAFLTDAAATLSRFGYAV